MPFLERDAGYRLYYEVAGDPRRATILLLEGMGGDVAGWRRNVPHLATELFVVAMDLHGNGRSDPIDGPVTIAALADDAVALLDELRVTGAHVFGMSMGGLVAQEMAIAHPDRVATLILGCTHPGGAYRVNAREPVRRSWEALYAPGFLESAPDHVAEDRAARAGRAQTAASRRMQRDAIRAFDAWDRLPGITAPTLVIHGTADRVIDVANAELLASRIPGARLHLIEGAGHVFHSERAGEVDGVVLDFVRGRRDG